MSAASYQRSPLAAATCRDALRGEERVDGCRHNEDEQGSNDMSAARYQHVSS
jgi:hypothetical protein